MPVPHLVNGIHNSHPLHETFGSARKGGAFIGDGHGWARDRELDLELELDYPDYWDCFSGTGESQGADITGDRSWNEKRAGVQRDCYLRHPIDMDYSL